MHAHLLALALSAASPEEGALAQRLQARAVTDQSFARAVLYTWTTPQQIAELQRSPELLTRTTFSDGTLAPFDQALVERAGQGDAMAKLLRRPGLSKRRFAWVSPYATALGVSTPGYGSRLIRVELRPEAWVARFAPEEAEPWSVVDLSGGKVALDVARAHPERLGAVLHVRHDQAGVAYREYVLCNESMIADWQWGTSEVNAELAEEQALLTELAGRLERLPPASAGWAAQAVQAWRAPPREPVALYEATLAFAVERYAPRPEALRALSQALEAGRVQGELLHQKPRAAFDATVPPEEAPARPRRILEPI